MSTVSTNLWLLTKRLSEAFNLTDPVATAAPMPPGAIPNTTARLPQTPVHADASQNGYDSAPDAHGSTETVVLPPFPQPPKASTSVTNDRVPVIWPAPLFSRPLPRTNSMVSMATTVAGGALNVLATQTSEIDYLKLILQASTRVYDVAIETPLQFAKNTSAKLGRDNKPVCFSFKLRGAYNRISQLSQEEMARGVICMSAGNHAQGVALAAQKLGIKATIVMPTSASEIKVINVRRLGATVVLHGADLEEAKRECLRLANEHGYIFIPPFDDPYIIAGQGTVGMEIIRQLRRGERLDAIFVPVGGGGLVAGITAFIKRVQPDIKIIGVNTEDSSGMTSSLQRGECTAMPKVGLFSDGTAVRQVGNETFRICSHLLDDMVLVTVDEICAAIKDVFDDTRSILEPAGALGVAGIKKYLSERGKDMSGGTFVAVTSGANMNFDRLRFVAERSRIGEGRECLLSCKVEERPGSFMTLFSMIYPRNVTEVSYRYSDKKEAHIYIAFDISEGKSEIQQLVQRINATPTGSMDAIDITENDMAKSHMRFLAGGRAPKNALVNEKLYRFSFAERPGAIKVFLDLLQSANVGRSGGTTAPLWNLTLIHYRNTGGDVAKVLIGVDVPKEDEESGQLARFLEMCNVPYVDETHNPVYDHFLR